MKDKTFGGALYFVTFVDNHSRKLWDYVLKSKDHTLKVFKQFHVMVKRQTGKSLKCICSDNGGEYIGLFNKHYKLQGIQHERTISKTPEQNGVTERMNQTIAERVRCMLSSAKLSKPFLGEAMRTVVDLINLSPATLLNDVPERLWSGKDVLSI